MPTGAKREPLKCFGCSKPCRDFGYWQPNTGRVYRYECVNRDCTYCYIPKAPEDIPGLYSTTEWKTKQ